jgi:RimJ/RimL family protein N-acetyltransferase
MYASLHDGAGTCVVKLCARRFELTMRMLHSDRLVLEPVDGRNARELWRILGAPDLRRFQDIPRLRAEEFERQVRSRPRALGAQVTGRFEWLVRCGNPLESIGWVSLRVNERAPDVGEIGYSLIESARGFGYATEALNTVVHEAFVASELSELQACCVPENAASRAVLDRAGFSELRLLRGGAMIRGRHVDVLLYSVARAQWDRERRSQALRRERA